MTFMLKKLKLRSSRVPGKQRQAWPMYIPVFFSTKPLPWENFLRHLNPPLIVPCPQFCYF